MPDLAQIMKELNLLGPVMPLPGSQPETVLKNIPADVAPCGVQRQVAYCIGEELQCCLRERITVLALCFARGEPHRRLGVFGVV